MNHRHTSREHGRRFVRGRSRGGDQTFEEGHGHHGRGSRRSRRLFDHGELRLVVLALVAERPRYGYEIIKEIEERVAGTYSPSPGVIYPTLILLEELGHATVTETDGKKLYTITHDGKTELLANKVAADGALDRMRAVSAANSGGPALEIIRATENVKLALRLRQSRGPLTEEQVRTIAEALDTAAAAIGRS